MSLILPFHTCFIHSLVCECVCGPLKNINNCARRNTQREIAVRLGKEQTKNDDDNNRAFKRAGAKAL
jgi:hypothetical protein